MGALAAIGAGTALPLMSIVFGGFVTEFTDFGAGTSTSKQFMDAIESLTYGIFCEMLQDSANPFT